MAAERTKPGLCFYSALLGHLMHSEGNKNWTPSECVCVCGGGWGEGVRETEREGDSVFSILHFSFC